jgi:hypothetical protein
MQQFNAIKKKFVCKTTKSTVLYDLLIKYNNPFMMSVKLKNLREKDETNKFFLSFFLSFRVANKGEGENRQ